MNRLLFPFLTLLSRMAYLYHNLWPHTWMLHVISWICDLAMEIPSSCFITHWVHPWPQPPRIGLAHKFNHILPHKIFTAQSNSIFNIQDHHYSIPVTQPYCTYEALFIVITYLYVCLFMSYLRLATNSLIIESPCPCIECSIGSIQKIFIKWMCNSIGECLYKVLIKILIVL